jgi:DDE superfamily endonuclease
MNKLVKVPLKLNPYLASFSDLFTRPSYVSFCHLTTTIAVCNKSKTIFNLHETMADDNKEKKGRSSYNWFITDGDWDENEIAQRKADLFFEELGLKEGNRILLIIDDTYNEKKGKHTEGVGKFFDHSKGFIWGNNIVTSVLQARGLFIPHKAKIYVKKEEAGLDFATKIKIAIKDIINPLKVPAGTELMVVFDSWWYSAALIKSCRELGHHVTCQIKSDKRVLLDSGEFLQVRSYAKRFDEKDFKEIKIKARGKKKSYFIVEQMVRLDKSRQVHLVISKENIDAEPKYYISTDTDLTAKKILSIYEDRWDIETAHREANQKLGFKDYQLRSKRSIERFMQLVFAIWTGILLVEIESPPSGSKKKTLGEMVDQVRSESIVDLMIYVMECLNLPVPDERGLLYKLKAIGLKLGK